MIFFVYSFDSRARRAALSLSLPRKLSCGVVGEHIAVAMPALSMSSSDFATDQLASGGLARFAFFTASSQVGGEIWWCTAMRCGLSCALRPDAANAPTASAAAPPASRLRRETVGVQQLQRPNSVRACVIASSRDGLSLRCPGEPGVR